ncbi:MAG: tRNA pseudouridine(55) synthase TruB [Phycisphaerales bacterium]|nr:tRNA pseudouridine(55) synthase TruB [Phycisphaerales bacterium]
MAHAHHAPSLAGFLLIDKPEGPSSMQAVARVRHRAGRTKTGHAGTLDPLASGLLVLGIGKATKMLQRAMDGSKVYETDIDLHCTSATLDREGDEAPVHVDREPSLEEVESALQAFKGEIEQAPPAFSAMKVDGRRAYALARKGAPPQLPPRPVMVHDIALLNYTWPLAKVRIHSGKGFYVRSLARDLGAALQVGGLCRTIRRLAVGPFSIDQAIRLEDVPDEISQDDLLSLEQVQSLLAGN